MKETRDPAIKLFGKEIPVPDNYWIPDEDSAGDFLAEDSRIVSSIMSACLEGKKVSRTGEEEEKAPEADKDSQPENYPPDNEETLPESEDNPRTPPINEENGVENPVNVGNENSDTNNSQQKTLKKPDKILPCPRCNSMDTKFCYYNNYNVNQPRHFCKSCQRYWTAGGTMRNVPVGAGRRKNKNSASHCHHITISEALQAARINHRDGIPHPIYGTTNGTVLSFGSETPICESIASGLKVVEKKPPNGIFQNGFYEVNCNGRENGSDCSTGSAVTTSNSMEEGKRNGPTGPQDLMVQNLNGFASQIPCLQGFPWPYPAVPIPGFGPPGYPFPIYPPPYWNCSIPGAWPVPWISPAAAINQKSPNSAPNSPLGKHSRNGELLKPSNQEPEEQRNSERLILIPKTLRIDDPDEAAKSSIWATLGIKDDSINRKGLFKAFQPKGDGKKDHVPKSLSSLRANPAAMSRSLNFQENS